MAKRMINAHDPPKLTMRSAIRSPNVAISSHARFGSRLTISLPAMLSGTCLLGGSALAQSDLPFDACLVSLTLSGNTGNIPVYSEPITLHPQELPVQRVWFKINVCTEPVRC